MSLLLSLEFDIFLVDEGMPTTADANFVRKAGDVLRQRLENATLVLVSHSVRQIETFCQEAAVLRNGKLHFFDSPQAAKAMYEYG